MVGLWSVRGMFVSYSMYLNNVPFTNKIRYLIVLPFTPSGYQYNIVVGEFKKNYGKPSIIQL